MSTFSSHHVLTIHSLLARYSLTIHSLLAHFSITTCSLYVHCLLTNRSLLGAPHSLLGAAPHSLLVIMLQWIKWEIFRAL